MVSFIHSLGLQAFIEAAKHLGRPDDVEEIQPNCPEGAGSHVTNISGMVSGTFVVFLRQVETDRHQQEP